MTVRAAIHPDQIPIINQAFAPSPDEVEFARRIVAAFASNGEAGTVGIEGKMFDIPHLKRETLPNAARAVPRRGLSRAK